MSDKEFVIQVKSPDGKILSEEIITDEILERSLEYFKNKSQEKHPFDIRKNFIEYLLEEIEKK